MAEEWIPEGYADRVIDTRSHARKVQDAIEKIEKGAKGAELSNAERHALSLERLQKETQNIGRTY